MTAVLYDYWRSSAAWRVRIALNLAGIAWTTVPVNLLNSDQSGPDNLARNPMGLVPTLDIDGLRLTQSLAIVEYLNDTRKLGLLPADPGARARVRALAQAVAMDIHPVCNLSVSRHAAAISGTPAPDWMRHFMTSRLPAVEALLDHPATGRFAHGDAPGLADLTIVPQLYNARRWGVDLSALPRLRAIDAACAPLPAFAAATPEAVNPQGS